ncbi:MAG: glycosyltransferase family 2 protein [Deltaproteobacteria bacterium]|nr:glycosyltransferase family 2 protein [Deltaproteobacteria bacterium]
MKKINILMATFNGGRYLSEQLDSLLEQTYEYWTLYIRDDGSSDDSMKIVKSYSKRDKRIQLLPSSGQNVGACQNFAQLMENTDGPYVMFCDQDDIWLPDKTETTLKVMKDSEKRFGTGMPILVHTDCAVVNSSCQVIHPSFMRYQKMNHVDDNPLRILLTQNFVTGCTVMINRALLSKCLPVPNTALMYDWWIALVAAALGKLVFIPHSTLLYRQHTDNVAGAKKIISRRNLRRLVNFEELDKSMIKLMLQNCALLKHINSQNDVKNNYMLEEFISSIKTRGTAAFTCSLKYRIVKQGILRNLLFFFQLAKGSYTHAIRSEYTK